MTDSITPPLELVQQWVSEFYGAPMAPCEAAIDLATRAAQWGADQELEACCHYFTRDLRKRLATELRSVRRPKPPSLKEQALALIDGCTDPEGDYLDDNALSIIRRALEALPND
jgi:hypothetical protein